MPRTPTFPLAAVFGAILSLGLGCSAERTTAPGADARAVVAPSATASHYDRTDHPARLVACSRRPEASDTELVGRRGGTLRFGGNSLTIPEGALDHTVRITARVVPNLDYLLVEFEPSGLHFDRPATLSLNVAGCALPHGSDPDVVYVGHDGRILERIEAVFSRWWQRVSAPIAHFSGYSIAL
ncbi:MAG TPA: hypothetical protein VGD77_16535 [Gemmatimonadaceae bacterium]